MYYGKFKPRSTSFSEYFFMAVILIIGPWVACQGCTDDEATRRVLKAQGFTDIQPGDYSHWSCGQDAFKTAFTAKNAQGNLVSGVVCCGFLKNCTVRF